MKKAIALLVALATVYSVGSTAIAATTTDGGITGYTEFAPGSTSAAPLLKLEKGQIVLGLSNDAIVLPETFLTPGKEYKYNVYRVDDDYPNGIAPNGAAMTLLTEGELDGAKLRLRTAKGSSHVTSAKLEKRSSGSSAYYRVVIEPKETYGTKTSDLEYTITVSGQKAAAPIKLLESTFRFETGYRSMDDDDIDSYDEGDVVVINDDTPVITKDQFNTLAKNFNYKAVEFEGEDGDWHFTGRVSGMSSANFLTSYDVVPELVNLYPEQDYKFITFPAGISFPTTGELRVDISDMDTTRVYAYLYRDNTLTPIATTYDNTSDELVFRTNYLGSFVITDVELSDVNFNEDEDDEDEDDNDTEGTNPPTGTTSAVGAIAALGLASLLTAGAVSRKRK